MKIIRWLLSHSLFILVIIAVIYAYMFWGNLLGEDTPAGKVVAYLSEEFVEVEEFVNAVKAKQAQLEEKSSSEQSSGSTVSETDAAEEKATEEKASRPAESIAPQAAVVANKVEAANEPVKQTARVEQTGAEQAVIMQQQPAIAQNQNNTAAVEQIISSTDSDDGSAPLNNTELAASQGFNAVNYPQPVSANANRSVETANTHTSTGERFVSAEVEKQLNNVDEHGEVIDVSQPSGTVRENWITARKAFYQRNYELSEQSYKQVIDSTKNNFDAYGELGNVYFNQGKNKQAAAAYFEAAAILINKGQVYRARSLMGLLRHLDETKADELQKLIDASRS